MDVLNTAGILMTAAGFTLTLIQTYRLKRMAKRNQERLELFIEAANYISFEHEIIDEIAKKLDNHIIHRFLVASHQRGCDLYRDLVDYYLSSEQKFTFNDLRRVCQTPLITYSWQEDFWRGRIAMRPENKRVEIPTERFLTENKSSRFKKLSRDHEVNGRESSSMQVVSDDDSPEDIVEIQTARADYQTGDYMTFDEYKEQRAERSA